MNKKINLFGRHGSVNVLLIVLVVVLFGVVGYFVLLKKDEPIVQQLAPTPLLTQTIIPEPTLINSTTSINDNKIQNFYKVKLSLNSGITKPKPYAFDSTYGASSLGNYLIDVLRLSKPVSTESFKKIISFIAYDSTQKFPDGENKFTHDYWILLKPGSAVLDVTKIYKTNELIATISLADQKLLPFVSNPSYCEIDSDCSVGGNDCSSGAYNKFRMFYDIFGCAGMNYPQENTKELNAMCEIGKQYPRVEYTGAKCISNKCIAQNRKVTCEAGTLP
ncbi:MAG: hypothetical protein Q8L47_00770 [bacterium]|nr:hypothetical protein [bacterium]